MAQQDKNLPAGWSLTEDPAPTQSEEGWSVAEPESVPEPGKAPIVPTPMRPYGTDRNVRAPQLGKVTLPTETQLGNRALSMNPSLHPLGDWIDVPKWEGFAQSTMGGEGAQAGLQGGLGWLHGATLDIPKSIYETVTGLGGAAYDFMRNPRNTMLGIRDGQTSLQSADYLATKLGIPHEQVEVEDMIDRAANSANDPYAFGRSIGQTYGQPAVTGTLVPKGVRATGKGMAKVGNVMAMDQPFAKAAPGIAAGFGGTIGTGLGYGLGGGFPGMGGGGITGGLIGRGLGFGFRRPLIRAERQFGVNLVNRGLNFQAAADQMQGALNRPIGMESPWPNRANWYDPSWDEGRIFQQQHGTDVTRPTRGLLEDPVIKTGDVLGEVPRPMDPVDPTMGAGPQGGGFFPRPSPAQLPPGPEGFNFNRALPEGRGSQPGSTVVGSRATPYDAPDDWIQLGPPDAATFDPMSPSPMHGGSPVTPPVIPPNPVVYQTIKKPSVKVTQGMKQRGYSLYYTDDKTGFQTWVKRTDVNAPPTPSPGTVLDTKVVPSPSGKLGDQLKKDGYIRQSNVGGKETWVRKQT